MAEPEEFTILTPNAMLGYGYRKDHFWYGIEKYQPSAIIVDSGSTDGGPYKLGLNKMTCGRGSYVRDLEPMLDAAYHKKIKLLISSVGGDGSNKHVQEMLGIVSEIAKSKGYSFKVATIDAGIDRDLLYERIREHKLGPCGPVDPLTEEDVRSAVDIVAQMGCEPYIKALELDPDIILGGRSYDPAPFAGFCLSKGVLPGVAWHMGKIMECGGFCAVPKGRSMIATIRKDSFDLTPLAAEERCTPLSVAAHTLYEKTRPDRLPGPGGVLELDNAKFEQITEKTTRISGAKFVPTPVYQVKLEGVTKLGYRTIFIGGIRDPILIGQIDDFLERVRKYTQDLFPELDQSESCRLIFHIYGKNAVSGPLEPNATPGHEIGIMGEVLAPTSELSHTIANNCRASILHFPYPGQIATTGNFASPLSPHETEVGPVFKFSLYHLVDLQAGEETSLFPVTMHQIQSDSSAQSLTAIEQKEYLAIENGTLTPITPKEVPSGSCKMPEIARIIRSKNSGPFELTLDIMFDSEEPYKRVKAADLLTNATIQKLYSVKPEDIITNMYFDPALAWKCTIRRPWPQGSVGERDTLGTQQHAPLLGIDVPAALINGSRFHGHCTDVLDDNVRDRSEHGTKDSVQEVWEYLGMPSEAVEFLDLVDADQLCLPSSFKVGHIAQMSIGLSALAAAVIGARRNGTIQLPRVRIPLRHACAEFKSEGLYTLNGKPARDPRGAIVGGLHSTSDGYVRIHDAFPHHRKGAFELLGLKPASASRQEVAQKIEEWAAVDLEGEAVQNNIVIGALRTFRQWDAVPQSRAIPDFPISLKRIGPGNPEAHERLLQPSSRCLAGLRVVELSRVIAAPVAGKTLAAHGADVIWITSPNLPDLPALDKDVGRGKRTVQLDIRNGEDKMNLLNLIRTADVFLQGYRPGALEGVGLGSQDLLSLNPNLIIANLSAYGPHGPWAKRRGFDSIIQTVSGLNVSEAEHAEKGEAARPLPCQALDHASGYFLATGIMAAVYKRMTEGGAFEVDVSLAGTMKYLRSLGQYEGDTGFQCENISDQNQNSEYIETRNCGFGELSAVRHSATIEGYKVGWDVMPKALGSDQSVWK